MKKKLKQLIKWALPVFILLYNTGIYGQPFEAALKKQAARYSQQKIYIHYDKGFYIPGETIWFKAYLYSNGLPDITSNNFYLQLLNENNELHSQYKYPINGAAVKGNIDLPDSLPQGTYYLRAFTPDMLNGNPEFVYVKKIVVVGQSAKKTEVAQTVKPAPLSIQFFPESGNMIEDILTVVAFKAVDSLGNPAAINGSIKTEDDTHITGFSTFHDGIGRVQFRPQAGKKYLAVVKVNGEPQYFPLPAVQPSGINLRVENETGGKVFQLTRSKKNKSDLGKVWLVAEMNSKIVYANEIFFDNYFSVKGHLLTDSMPSGIIHFTVLNSDFVPLAERLSFVNNGEYITKAEIEIIKTGNGPRQENDLSVVFAEAFQRSCSVSITDITVSPDAKADNIISSLLLTSDLKGYIHNPAFYFQQNNESTRQALDNLMLTHGWTRYKWEEILREDFPAKNYSDTYLISVSGYLKDSKTKAAVDKGRLVLFVESEDSVNHSFEVNVDAKGGFTVDSLLVFGKTKMYYAYTSLQGKEKTVDMELRSFAADSAVEVFTYNIPEKEIKQAFENFYSGTGSVKQQLRPDKSKLEETKELSLVLVESKSNKRPIDIVNETYAKGVFTSMGKVNIDNINEPVNDKSISAYDYIRTFIRQVEIQDGNFVNRRNFSISAPMTQEQEKEKQKEIDKFQNNPYGQNGGKEFEEIKNRNAPGKKFIVATFLNESPVDISFLKTIRMDEVALLKFYEPGFLGASSGGPGGALAIYTKQTDVKGTPGPGVEKLDYIEYKGYSITKEFYNPDYSQPASKNEFEDTRSTLYWSPDLYTSDGSKSINLRFYNNDFSKKFRVIVQGFDASGRLIYLNKVVGE